MPISPFRCTRCTNETWKLVYCETLGQVVCPLCSNEAQWISSHPRGSAPMFSLGAHPSERCVVWENPKDGSIRYPGRNDAHMPDRYAQQGFQRKELATLRDIDKFDKSHGTVNEVANFNSGNGID